MAQGVFLVLLLAAACHTTLTLVAGIAAGDVEDEGTDPLPYVGEIRWVTFKYAPQGWAICHGQYVRMRRFRSLLSVIRNTYGQTKFDMFALPNLVDAPVNKTSTLSEDEVQIFTKDLDIVPIIALEGALPSSLLYPIIHPDENFTVETEDLDDMDEPEVPEAPRDKHVSQAEADKDLLMKVEKPEDLTLREKMYK